jgi:hypothetical protein
MSMIKLRKWNKRKLSDPDVEAGQEPLRTTISRASDAPTITSATQDGIDSLQSYIDYANLKRYPEARLLEDQLTLFSSGPRIAGP